MILNKITKLHKTINLELHNKDQRPKVINELEKLVEKARKDLGDNLTGRLGENRREPGFSDAAED